MIRTQPPCPARSSAPPKDSNSNSNKREPAPSHELSRGSEERSCNVACFARRSSRSMTPMRFNAKCNAIANAISRIHHQKLQAHSQTAKNKTTRTASIMKARQSIQAIRVGTRKLASPQSSSASSSSSRSSRSATSDGARRSLSTKILGSNEKDVAASPEHENAEEDADDSLPRIILSQQPNGTGVPIHLYTHDIEPQALEQVRRLAESPLPIDYVAVMPDAHLGVR